MAVAAAEPLQLSVIIPALNESAAIRATLQALQPLRARGHEVIVVDGGSHDLTVELSRPLSDRVIAARTGRAAQMREGVAAAAGTVLWFLHADTVAPQDADRLILEALQQRQADWGRFDIRLSQTRTLLRCVAWMMNQRSRLSGTTTGDQGIFVTRRAYEATGGFPEIPLMEDIALSRALCRHGRPARIRTPLVSSPRRWLTHGVLRTILRMWMLRLAYFLGVNPERLAAYYAPHRS
ncbi:MAG TPA: TIGR04283 family arsenosugar biosynthesis glycosyltransferase [Gammaproteobacteria bacterium]|nr:TIGR04283 family arsenosugar biosynthesis glycosyltransferase [Gammaproteobacteria bacterium]